MAGAWRDGRTSSRAVQVSAGRGRGFEKVPVALTTQPCFSLELVWLYCWWSDGNEPAGCPQQPGIYPLGARTCTRS